MCLTKDSNQNADDVFLCRESSVEILFSGGNIPDGIASAAHFVIRIAALIIANSKPKPQFGKDRISLWGKH
jgi:hypothetical protein